MKTTSVVLSPKSRRFSRLLRATIIVALVLLLLYLVERFVGERLWFSTLLTYAPQHWTLLLPMPVLLIALFRRRWKIVSANLGLLVFTIVGLMGFCWRGKLHQTVKVPSADLRIMTFNIEHGKAGVNRIADVIHTYRPDVVCLNEVNQEDGSTKGAYEALRKALPGYQFTPTSETVIASRLPLFNVQRIPLANFAMRRPAVLVTTSIHGKNVTIIAAHLAVAATPETMQKHRGTLGAYLDRTVAARQSQTTQLLNVVAEQTGPVILCGDFNTPPRGRIYAQLTRKMDDAFAASCFGFGHTFSSKHPLLRIDYVFTAGGASARSCTVPPVQASDHLPLVADIDL